VGHKSSPVLIQKEGREVGANFLGTERKIRDGLSCRQATTRSSEGIKTWERGLSRNLEDMV